MARAQNARETSAAKSIGLGDFDLIEAIKSRLAAAGGGDDASCADILAFAARDAATILSGGRIRYAVRRGRRDGVASSADAAEAALPGPASSFAELEESFASRGLGKGDLAALSGAHAVGAYHGSSFADRLRPSVAAAYQINGTYLLQTAASDSATTTETITMMNNARDMDPASAPSPATASSGWTRRHGGDWRPEQQLLPGQPAEHGAAQVGLGAHLGRGHPASSDRVQGRRGEMEQGLRRGHGKAQQPAATRGGTPRDQEQLKAQPESRTSIGARTEKFPTKTLRSDIWFAKKFSMRA
ncbi:peroxidase 52-like [Panicum miliaceum]|uniref:Peroxidase n=1 Tax=Panicum miliaceum TaxID=4540 RepID=A0A3L6R4U1_PANMI|nr:peroxidase 52-like [Panicum miliaceum]